MHGLGAARELALPISLLVSFAAGATAQEPAAALRYEREGGELWRVEPTGRFRVDPEVISARFVEGIGSLAELLAAAGPLAGPAGAAVAELEVVRVSRLGVADLRVPAGADVLAVRDALRATGLCRWVEENTFGVYGTDPNDPQFPQQYSLRNTGQTGGTPDADIDADLAWDITTGVPSVWVAVIDSGTQISHPDLAANVWTNPGEIAGNGVDDDANGYVDDVHGWDFEFGNNDPESTFYHGTAVAGVVAAVTNSGTGIAGVAGGDGTPGSGCRVMPCGIGQSFPIGTVLDDAILYAAENGARIITLSLTVGTSQAITDAVRDAHDVYGVFIDNAAGNGGFSVGYPANLERVVAVASCNDDGVRVSSSNQGPEVFITAPGDNIYMLDLGGGYGFSSGTSFASPHVAGVAALLLSVAPALGPDEVKAILMASATDIDVPGFDNRTGWGLLNARTALDVLGGNDCDGNGVFDGIDIANGEPDDNVNGVPDVCETGVPFCYGDGTGNACPCGNTGAAEHGCVHSGGTGMRIRPGGSTSLAADDFRATAVFCPPNNSGIFYCGRDALPGGNALFDGLQCAGGDVRRFQPRFQTSGTVSDTGFAAQDPSGTYFQPAETYIVQYWSRDVDAGPSPCGTGANFSPALRVVMQP